MDRIVYSTSFETVWKAEHERKSRWGHRVFSVALIVGYPTLSLLYYLNNHSHFTTVLKLLGSASLCFSIILFWHVVYKLTSQKLAFYNFLILVLFHATFLATIPHAAYERSCFNMTVCLLFYCLVIRLPARKTIFCTVLILILFPFALYWLSTEALFRFLREGGVFFFLAQCAFPFVVHQRYTHEKRSFYYQHSLMEQNVLLEKQVAIAQEATKAKADFLSMMSHEIRTPLNGIVGGVHLLDSENIKNDFQKELIQTLLFSSNHLMSIVNDILDLNKINSNHVKLGHKPFDPALFLENLKKTFLPKFKDKNVRLVFDIQNELPAQLISDEGKLHQILTNLIHNAIKFTETGEVRLAVTEVNRSEKFVNLYFEVIDTGIGIPLDQQQRIFELFTQAENQNARKYGGTGLGLTITKELLKLFGSEIKLSSDSGRGAVFSFEIEFAYTNEVKTLRLLEPKLSQVHDSTSRVLVVDDNATNLLLATSFLHKIGIETDTAADGKQAFEKFRNNTYDLILMDLRMPVMNGFDATRLIRESGSDVPIIALTASAFEDEKEKALTNGFSDHLVKPFLPADFYQMVFTHLKTRKPLDGSL